MSKPKEKKTSILALVIAFILTKGATILKALKALKYAKFAITAITMSVSALLYGFAFGSWYFALGLVLLLLVHEYGHVFAMWKKGIHASAPVFIPFLGAAIFAKIPDNKADEAYIGYGGPLLGTVGALLCIAVALMLPEGTFWSTLLHILGNVGLFLNLFNLIPARPLDGGRILHPLGSGVSYVGFAILALLALFTKDTFFLLIALLATDQMPIRPTVRSGLWGVLWGGFAVEFFFFPMNWLTLGVGTFFSVASVYMLFCSWQERGESLPDIVADNDRTPVATRIKWLAYYTAILGVILGVMMWHTEHLPKEVRESSLMKYVHEF